MTDRSSSPSQDSLNAWHWLERFAWGWQQNHGDAQDYKPQKHICWLEKGIEVFDHKKQLYVVPYDVNKYEGEDFFHDKIELWVRPEPKSPIYKVPSEQILAFDEKQGYLFIKLGAM